MMASLSSSQNFFSGAMYFGMACAWSSWIMSLSAMPTALRLSLYRPLLYGMTVFR